MTATLRARGLCCPLDGLRRSAGVVGAAEARSGLYGLPGAANDNHPPPAGWHDGSNRR